MNPRGMSDLSLKSSIERALDALYKRKEQLDCLIEELESIGNDENYCSCRLLAAGMTRVLHSLV